MGWLAGAAVFFACVFFFIYAVPYLFLLTLWILLKRYLGRDFREGISAVAADDDDEKFGKLLLGGFAKKNLFLHWQALRLVEALIDLGLADDESHGNTRRTLQRAIDQSILPPDQPLQNFVSIGGGDLLCDSQYGCFLVFVAGGKGLRNAKTEGEREVLKKFHDLIRRQRFFILVVKKVLPRFLPVVTYDPKVERLL